jgi:exonuclease SbcC
MRIKLKELTITNFKGIKSFKAYFDFITTIFGANASGKTTVFDAFLWLFFGKNSEDKTDFEKKPLDKNNNFIKDLETEVEAIIETEGHEIAVKKVLRQKWTTPKASTQLKYTGDENTYYWNDVPIKEADFKEKIKKLVGDESLFRLITNPFYFNNLKWQERRQILMDIAGEVSNYEVLDKVMNAENKNLFDEIVKALNQKKTLAEYQAEISAKKKKIKDEMALIPSRIDEVQRGKPQPKDFPGIRKQIEVLQEELNAVTASLDDEQTKLVEENKIRTQAQKDYNDKVQAKQRKIFDIKNKMQNIEFDVKLQAKNTAGDVDAEIRSAQTKLQDLKLDETKYKTGLKSLEHQLTAKQEEVDALLDKCDTIEGKEFVFDELNCKCPTCQQQLPAGDVASKKETLLANFNQDKRKRLDETIAKGKAVKDEVGTLETRISNGKKSIEETVTAITVIETKLTELQQKATEQKSVDEVKKELLAAHEEYQLLNKEYVELENTVITAPVFDPLQTNQALKEKQANINSQITQLQRDLALEEQITKADARIKELTEQESALSQKLAELEGIEFAILEFTKAKMDIIDQRINNKFRFVKFKMFDRQTNGQEVPTCQTLINSNGSPVPFDSANNAARINAGIDIINALSDHYGIYAPVFVDNAESITDIIESDSQMIRLVVMKGAKLSVNEIEYAENFKMEVA